MNKCFVFDLDSTLSSLNGRNPYDESACEQDGVTSLAVLYRALANEGYTMIVATGRHESARAKTLAWLEENKLLAHMILMRPDPSSATRGREESAVSLKLGMYRRISEQNDVLMWFDDSLPVCQELTKNGVNVFLVTESNNIE